MINVSEVDLTSRRQVKQFLDFPFQLYAATPQWVPPLAMDARQMLNPAKHPFYRHGRAIFLLASEHGRVVGRLAVLVNDRYVEFNQDPSAFFYLFECENRPEAAGELFAAGAEWARRQGMQRMMGPKGFTVFDGIGMLSRGYEHRPAFGLPYNLPYYPALMEALGFTGMRELLSGYLNADRIDFPEKIEQVANLLIKRRGLEVAAYKTRGDLWALVPRLKEMYNNALGGTNGNYPLDDADVQGLANQMAWFADPRLIKVVMKGEQPVGFLFAYPDVSAAVQRGRGRLWPLGWLWLLWELRRTDWFNINGAGMIEGYRGLGGTALLFSEMYHAVKDSRYRHADLVQIGTENENMLRELRELGVDFYKAHRLYCKDL